MVGFVSNLFGSTFSYVTSPNTNSTVARVVTSQVIFASTTMLNDEDFWYGIASLPFIHKFAFFFFDQINDSLEGNLKLITRVFMIIYITTVGVMTLKMKTILSYVWNTI